MKKNILIIYYICSAIWYLLAVYMFLSGKSGIGVVYMSIGSMWLCIGSAMIVKNRKNEQTLKYYDDNVDSFFEHTENVDMSETQNKFLELIPDGGLILDWGCGSGRDSLAFINAGYSVEAVDASIEVCKRASEKLGIEVQNKTFDELDAKNIYDGIWACASLLHVGKNYLPNTIEQAVSALKFGGVLYMSFKYGDYEGERDGRYFTDLTEDSFAKLIKPNKKVEIIEQWITSDARPGREDEKWLNVIVKKVK